MELAPETLEQNGTVYLVRCVLKRDRRMKWGKDPISSSHEALKFVNFIRKADREHMVTICLSTKNYPIAYSVTAIGTGNTAYVRPGELYRVPLLAGATAVIVAHNHPSGDPRPSQQDRDFTQRLSDAAKLLGLRLVDHLIVGPENRYHSFSDYGEMPSGENSI
ncbi:MAG: JAB domain-containing protein [Bdellovibrionota bacterium]